MYISALFYQPTVFSALEYIVWLFTGTFDELPYSYKFSRVLIFAQFDCAKFEQFRSDLFSRTLNFDNFRAPLPKEYKNHREW